jgi:hypothetical protein
MADPKLEMVAADLAAEAARLRAALYAITQEIPTFLLTNETGSEVYERHVAQIKAIHKIANAALAFGDQDAPKAER